MAPVTVGTAAVSSKPSVTQAALAARASNVVAQAASFKKSNLTDCSGLKTSSALTFGKANSENAFFDAIATQVSAKDCSLRNRSPSQWNATSALRCEISASSRSSSSSGVRAEAVEETRSGSGSVVAPAEEKGFEVPSGGCATCGKAEKVGGCNGEGRIQGGIGAVPGFGWWPIMAFRPCPAFVEYGGKYKRIGQSLDEVAFGRASAGDDLDISERLKGR